MLWPHYHMYLRDGLLVDIHHHIYPRFSLMHDFVNIFHRSNPYRFLWMIWIIVYSMIFGSEAETGRFSYSPPRPAPGRVLPTPARPAFMRYLLYENVIYFIIHQKQSEERTNTDKGRVFDTRNWLVGFLFRWIHEVSTTFREIFLTFIDAFDVTSSKTVWGNN